MLASWQNIINWFPSSMICIKVRVWMWDIIFFSSTIVSNTIFYHILFYQHGSNHSWKIMRNVHSETSQTYAFKKLYLKLRFLQVLSHTKTLGQQSHHLTFSKDSLIIHEIWFIHCHARTWPLGKHIQTFLSSVEPSVERVCIFH